MSGFDKAQRLRTKADYDFVFAEAKKIITSEFTVLYRKNLLKRSRLGLAISKKVIPRAHERNRIKRILRESFRKNTLPDVDLIFLARKGTDLVENSVLFANLSNVWTKLITI